MYPGSEYIVPNNIVLMQVLILHPGTNIAARPEALDTTIDANRYWDHMPSTNYCNL